MLATLSIVNDVVVHRETSGAQLNLIATPTRLRVSRKEGKDLRDGIDNSGRNLDTPGSPRDFIPDLIKIQFRQT